MSPFDERVRPEQPLAPRPAAVGGLHVSLLDIRKNRGAEFLDRIETLLPRRGRDDHPRDQGDLLQARGAGA